MTFVAPDPVASGRPYSIVRGAADPSNDLGRFVGEASFTIDRDGVETMVRGTGALDETGVRFYEKDLEHSGKDVRAWHITEGPAGHFVATPVAIW